MPRNQHFIHDFGIRSLFFIFLVLTEMAVLVFSPQIQRSSQFPIDLKDPLLNQGPKTNAFGEEVTVSTQPAIAIAEERVLEISSILNSFSYEKNNI